ncbi:hypothetical protein EJD96_20925 [Herbaspirillum seropedicae]|uniref:glycosyltransferase family 10 domain-containing protein n=1 Tax=Herbaspirillum seropedicae TaxID=964 RepID=UPI001122CC14|nr:glycosyltransferase family 10 [Herbaspirillum seropedicae]QDD66449.1 hypothetical protein EJD96_20925 [Herbaspirillum seropedicae]
MMKSIFVDPPSPAYYENRLFDMTNQHLNRDDTLMPFVRLREALQARGARLDTADYLPQQQSTIEIHEYYSLGVLENYKALLARPDVRLKAFVIFEPPVVEPRLYDSLPELTAAFEHVYVHNTVGDGYSLAGVDASKLRKLYWPQPRRGVISQYWERQERQQRIVVINGNHIPQPVANELYSKRIEAMAALAKFSSVDLYGRGWHKWWSRASMWWPYWKNRRTLMSIYHGACDSKYEVLSRYAFSLCFENMAMQGYVTEKLFDCLYAGTVPLYLGATDIADLIPSSAYIDCRQFASWKELHAAVMALSAEKIEGIRQAGRAFIEGPAYNKYYAGLSPVFDLNSPNNPSLLP